MRLIALMRALNRVEASYVNLRHALGMKESLFVLLYACADGEPRSQKEICEEWYVPRSTLNTTVAEQVRAGNVELVPRGNRQKDIRLTDKGYDLAERLLGPLLQAEEQVAREYVDDALLAGLESFADGLGEALAQTVDLLKRAPEDVGELPS